MKVLEMAAATPTPLTRASSGPGAKKGRVSSGSDMTKPGGGGGGGRTGTHLLLTRTQLCGLGCIDVRGGMM